jgi:hypothetical protein
MFYKIEAKCGHEGCETPRAIFVHSYGYMTEDAAIQKVRDANPRPLCAGNHVFARDFTLISIREVFSLID